MDTLQLYTYTPARHAPPSLTSPPTNQKPQTGRAPPRVRGPPAHQRPRHRPPPLHPAPQQARLSRLSPPLTTTPTTLPHRLHHRHRRCSRRARRLPAPTSAAPLPFLLTNDEPGGRPHLRAALRGPPRAPRRLQHLPPPRAPPGAFLEGTKGIASPTCPSTHPLPPSPSPTPLSPIPRRTAQPAAGALPTLLPPGAGAAARPPRRARLGVRGSFVLFFWGGGWIVTDTVCIYIYLYLYQPHNTGHPPTHSLIHPIPPTTAGWAASPR